MKLENDGSGREFAALVALFEGQEAGRPSSPVMGLRDLSAAELRAVRAMLTPLRDHRELLAALMRELVAMPPDQAQQIVSAMLVAIERLLGPKHAA
jgi:hypothetical protein